MTIDNKKDISYWSRKCPDYANATQYDMFIESRKIDIKYIHDSIADAEFKKEKLISKVKNKEPWYSIFMLWWRS